MNSDNRLRNILSAHSTNRSSAMNRNTRHSRRVNGPRSSKRYIRSTSSRASRAQLNMVKTYIYYGHGKELSITNDKQVPSGCTLSTISESGIQSYLVALFALGNLAIDYTELLNDPIANKQELKLKCRGIGLFEPTSPIGEKLIEGAYHLKERDFWYKDKHCNFLLAFSDTGKIEIHRSGLYEINQPGVDLPRTVMNSIRDNALVTIEKGIITL